MLKVSKDSVHRTRERLVLEGLESALNRKPHSRIKPRKLDGRQEAISQLQSAVAHHLREWYAGH